MKPRDKQYLDATLYQAAYWYMRKKRIELTTGNLFWIMNKIQKKIDYINKNKKDKIINFTDGHCEINE